MNILFKIVHDLVFFAWDISLTAVNLVTPNKRIGHVVPNGHPGFGGEWPEYIAPQKGDSRCSCPALNALANHGILPRDGKNIQFKEIGRVVHATYNFSQTFCYFVPHYAAQMLHKSYGKDTIDLEELDLHNGIEHDASLVREDSALEPDQSKPHVGYIKELLACASGKDKDGSPILTTGDISKFSSKRRADARGYNKSFSLDFQHKIFGSINASTLVVIFGGRVKDLEILLLEERLPEHWEPKTRQRLGITLAQFNLTTGKVELGISEKKYLREKKKATEAVEAGTSSAVVERASVPGDAPGTDTPAKLIDVE